MRGFRGKGKYGTVGRVHGKCWRKTAEWKVM